MRRWLLNFNHCPHSNLNLTIPIPYVLLSTCCLGLQHSYETEVENPCWLGGHSYPTELWLDSHNLFLLLVGRGSNSWSAIGSTKVRTGSTSPSVRADWSYSEAIGSWPQRFTGIQCISMHTVVQRWAMQYCNYRYWYLHYQYLVPYKIDTIHIVTW